MSKDRYILTIDSPIELELFPDIIPIWSNIWKLSEDRASLEKYLESINEILDFEPIFFQISPRFSGNRQEVSL
ncbi:hypothetical protein [Chamaesiphon minutus]|uniref:Uncharacterized protein n=1 Tax=Chamaesiphon minutus (strain ATCC 27169 / PCC 6605) TaxID=1173020 RepID=K9URB4_CHAP6|nr:hypothetical protein [Chamaesiphon minutus]AFY97001.1 hypothetical protein Cha6605_6171 [Chamaesiphon minutus PCC 6605]